jgi:alpha-L-arabinofuranosidase
MYAAHQGGQSLRTVFSAPLVHYDRDGNPASFSSLRGSASLREKELTLTTVNSHISESRETELLVRGGTVESVNVTVLTNADIHAHNTPAEPNAVVPKDQSMAKGTISRFVFPPASVTKLVMTLS